MRNIIILIFWLCTTLGVVHAQTLVTGTVSNELGEPLNGVSVSITGQAVVTKTNNLGKYEILTNNTAVSLSFSFMGYSTEVKSIGNNKIINVTLFSENKSLDEVVVVGYGTQKRRDVTGAVVSLKTSDLENMPNVNIVQSLQGKMPGLNVINTGSSAEGSVRMRVRAKNSINADASPLIILDGIQYEGMLSEISPNDIESIEVLKDASAAAIYGARAAGGVLLITTKQGIVGKTAISFSSSLGYSNIINRPDMMDGVQYYNFKKIRVGVGSFETQQFEKGVSTDWLGLAMQTGVSREGSLSISGGTEKTKYYVSGNLSKVDGVAKNDIFNRINTRVNLTTNVTSWLQFGTNTLLGYAGRPGVEANLSNANLMNPLTEPYDEFGNLNLLPNIDDLSVKNPLEGLNIMKDDISRSVNTINFVNIKFPFIEGLSFKTIAGYYFRNRFSEMYQSREATFEGQSKLGIAAVTNQYGEDWSIENILSYNKKIGLHSFDFTGVYTARENIIKQHNNEGVGFDSDLMTYYQFKLATTLTPSDSYNEEHAISQLGRINYNYDSKYLLTVSVRRDGFSAFGSNNKYGVFPSVALGWNIDRESFMEKVNWVDRSKLRLSYGESGNQAIAAYATMPTMSNAYYLDENKNPLIGFYPNKLADQTLSWETTRQVNLGFDFGLFNERVFGSFDYFSANTFDLLLNKKVPQINGVNTIRQNIGETKSHGVELALSTVNIKKKDFTWTTQFNFSHNRNKIVNVGLFDTNGNPMDNLGSRWFIGEPIDVIYSYKFDGIWQETDDILSSHMPESKPGDVRVKDYNGDGKITEDDRHIIGYSEPNFRIGLMNTMRYKDVSFSFFINAVEGVTKYTEYNNTYFGKSNIRQRQWWTVEKPINTYPANRDDSNPYGVNYYDKTNNASYIRLSDISLSYSFPQALINHIKISKLDFFANVKNVLTLTNYIGLDPEFSEDYGVPQTRTFLFGFRLSF